MSRRRKIEPFFIVVTDSDAGLFNVVGPMSDDTAITSRVFMLQKDGRNVSCCSAGEGQSREQIIDSFAKFHGLTHTNRRLDV